MVSGVLAKARATVRSRVMFQKVVVHVVLLYGGDMWFIMDLMMNLMEGFHHHISRRVTGKTACRVRAEGWQWDPVQDSLEEVVLCPMQDYSRQRQANIGQCIDTQPIYELCTGAEQFQETSFLMGWWDQDCSRSEGSKGFSGEKEGKIE